MKEKEEAMAQCERQIIEMSATLERYTMDHQKLLANKDKQIEELRASNTQLSSANKVRIKLLHMIEICKKKCLFLNESSLSKYKC